MKSIKWSALPEAVRTKKTVTWTQLPPDLDLESIPADVTIMPITGEDREQAIREFTGRAIRVSERLAAEGVTDEEIDQYLNEL